MKRIISIPRKSRGVTMLENMVALLILSIGLLGLAGLQASSIRASANASMRTIAIQQAYDMADRILANQAGAYGNPNGQRYDAIAPPAAAAPVDCTQADCNALELAQFDEEQWNTANASLLPSGGGWVVGTPIAAVAVPVGMPQRMQYVITVRWDGNRNGAAGLGCDPTNANDLKCFVLEVYP